ncbi:D-alanyl-D-alanine dipeptidase [Magnetospirillum sp. UT-4]|uniref:D-alanyl-D-alanine dipeptidase n=1 Tax=Magnetospirillum sp. UT-4 TaxID=2681467 RepID=UPI00137F9516|nr:D-alanyl-D-alanine dipeptidase [Magnetospirillum sp. UT-4]CAA7624527.1 D-alanyl-D-alanine dipeptidase [Magnetospirillum sp. UT-4]
MVPLVRIGPPDLDVEVALAYATADNFTGRPVYRPDAGCFLVAEAAERLAEAARLARALGLRLRILDAFRPVEAQWVLWTHTPDPDFLADPRRGSLHSRGAAVDLTLVDDAGAPLDMGTAFDAFTPESHHGAAAIPAAAQANRHLLLGLMTAAGWDHYRKEWWHYQLFAPHPRHPLLSDSVLGRDAMMPR